ncbi:MAG: GNAT family N-acetyltransferase [Bacteroidales bacterium]|nr:GNAT family N-acetyltransferase [Bacteroidales bacterium]
MNVRKVVSPADKKEFLLFPKRLYSKDPHWVCPLDNEIAGIFDPEVNRAFSHGEAERWLLINGSGETVGRIAAFIDEVRAKVYRYRTGGLGFFEVINDREAAFMLFDTAREWLVERGVEAIDGPINFGENDSHWGLLVEGFMQQAFGLPYNMSYYRNFFEEYGFRNYFEQYSYHKDIAAVEVFPERFMKIADWISKRPGYSFHHFTRKERVKFASDMADIYNSTWSQFKEDFTPLEPEILLKSLEKSSAFMDEELIWFAYHNDKPVAFFVILPDLNQILKHLDGRLTLINKIRFLWYKSRKTMTRLRAVVAGVNPSYQNSGIESAIFKQLYHVFKSKPHYRELELSWVGDFNPKMISIYEAIGAERKKMHITYRYLVDPGAPFTRYKDEMESLSGDTGSKEDKSK